MPPASASPPGSTSRASTTRCSPDMAAGEAAIEALPGARLQQPHARALHRIAVAVQRLHRFPRLPPRSALRQRRAAAEPLPGDGRRTASSGCSRSTATRSRRSSRCHFRTMRKFGAKPQHLVQRPLSGREELPMVMTTHEEKMRTVRFKVDDNAAHRRRSGQVQDLFGQGLRLRLSGQPVRAARRRQRAVQLRAMLRVRDVFSGVQQGRGAALDLSRRRLRRHLPRVVNEGALSDALCRLPEPRSRPRNHRGRSADRRNRRRADAAHPQPGRRRGAGTGAAAALARRRGDAR